MIQIHINPARVEKVIFVATSAIEEDFDLAAWAVIKPYVNSMDRRLRNVVRRLQEERVEEN
jgi:hypothetical protein